MDMIEFEQGMNLAFRINELQKDVAAFLKDNYSSTAALPVFEAERQLHKVIGGAVHRTFREMLQKDPKMRDVAEEEGIPKEKIDEILSMGDAPSAGDVNFEPIE